MKTMLAPKSTVLNRNRIMSDNAACWRRFGQLQFGSLRDRSARRAFDVPTENGSLPERPGVAPSRAVARRLRFYVFSLMHLEKQHLCQRLGRQHAVVDIGCL
jgi:hypothetical protein